MYVSIRIVTQFLTFVPDLFFDVFSNIGGKMNSGFLRLALKTLIIKKDPWCDRICHTPLIFFVQDRRKIGDVEKYGVDFLRFFEREKSRY